MHAQSLSKLDYIPISALPDEDGVPMENFLHRFQQNLLLESLTYHWRDRQDYFAGANMFVYFSYEQAEEVINGEQKAYRGPDFFVVLDTTYQPPRTKWVVWAEGGRYPDVIVEILSPSTEQVDRVEKMKLYERVFQTSEYFLIDFEGKTLEGYELHLKRYRAKEPNPQGWLWSAQLGLWLGLWEGVYQGYQARWFRFYTEGGELVLTRAEAEQEAREQAEHQAELERQRAEAERQRAEAERQRAEAERIAREQAEQRAQQAEAELQRLRALLAQREPPEE